MHRSLCLFLALFGTLGLASAQQDAAVVVNELAVAPAEQAEDIPLAPPTAEALRQLAGGLASEHFEIRDRSQAALAKYSRLYPQEVKDGLAQDYVDSLDPEMRYRLAEVIYDAVVEGMEHSGFLGIIMLPSIAIVEDLRVPSIQVNTVLPKSAAAEAGLRPGDQIIQVDDLIFDAPGGAAPRQPNVFRGGFQTDENLNKFKDYIGGRKKGTKVTLKVQRRVGNELRMLDVDVRLGKRARDLMEPAERTEEERFFDQWLQNRRSEAKP